MNRAMTQTPQIHPDKRELETTDSFKPRIKRKGLTQIDEVIIPEPSIDSDIFSSQKKHNNVIRPVLNNDIAPVFNNDICPDLVYRLDDLQQRIQSQITSKMPSSFFAEMCQTLVLNPTDPTGRDLHEMRKEEAELRARLDQLQAELESKTAGWDRDVQKRQQQIDYLENFVTDQREAIVERANKDTSKYDKISSLKIFEENSRVYVSFENGIYTVKITPKPDQELVFKYSETIGQDQVMYEFVSATGLDPGRFLKSDISDLTHSEFELHIKRLLALLDPNQEGNN